MFVETDRQTQIRSIVDDFNRALDGRAERSELVDAVTAEYDRLCAHAAVDTFIPIFVRRHIADQLTELDHSTS